MGYLTKSNPSAAEIRDELTSVFKGAVSEENGFLDDCVQLAHFLSQTDLIMAQLKILDQKLTHKVDQHLGKVIDHYRTLADGKASTLDAELKHLLSNEMSLMEIQWGFNSFACAGYDQGKVQTYTGFVKPDAFRQQVQLGRHWKDPGVPGLHGEYTHRIQWYLACNYLQDLAAKPVPLFMGIGGVVNPEKDSNGLWDALCDRDGGEAENIPFKINTGVTDCRAPESFTALVIDTANENEFPILHWFIRSRLKKRQGEALNTYYGAKQYVLKKLKKFGIPDEKANEIVGKPMQFTKGGGTKILQPGAPVTRT